MVDYIWNDYNYTFLSPNKSYNGEESIIAYQKEAYEFDKKDVPMTEGTKLRSYLGVAPPLVECNNNTLTHGGPVYMSVGQNMTLNMSRTLEEGGNTSYYGKEEFIYAPAFVEYYYYKSPVAK